MFSHKTLQLYKVFILEWVAIPFSKGIFPRDWTWVSCIAGRFFTVWAIREAPYTHIYPCIIHGWASLGGSDGKESACNMGDLSSIPGLGRFPWRRAWKPTPVSLPGDSLWTEEPGRLQTIGSQRVRHDWVTKHNTYKYSLLLNVWPHSEGKFSSFRTIFLNKVFFYYFSESTFPISKMGKLFFFFLVL